MRESDGTQEAIKQQTAMFFYKLDENAVTKPTKESEMLAKAGSMTLRSEMEQHQKKWLKTTGSTD